MARKRLPPPTPWPDRLSLVNEICRQLRAGTDIGVIVTVLRVPLRLVLDLRRANQRADEIRKRWHCGLYRVLGSSEQRQNWLPRSIDAEAKTEREQASEVIYGQRGGVPDDEEAETSSAERERRRLVQRRNVKGRSHPVRNLIL